MMAGNKIFEPAITIWLEGNKTVREPTSCLFLYKIPPIAVVARNKTVTSPRVSKPLKFTMIAVIVLETFKSSGPFVR